MASRTLSVVYDSTVFLDARVCVNILATVEAEHQERASACGTGSPVQFALRFDTPGNMSVIITAFTSEQQWQDGVANVSQALIVR